MEFARRTIRDKGVAGVDIMSKLPAVFGAGIMTTADYPTDGSLMF